MKNLWKRFVRGEEGSIFLATGLGLVALVAMMGASVDFARGYMLKSRLSAALDAAGLAGGAAPNSENIGAEIDKYFRANFPDGFMDATVDGPHYELLNNNHLIRLNVSATLPTTFMRVVGRDQMSVSADAEITRESKGMELVLVMDNTGSMSDNNKLTTMKSAATDLVNILYGDADEEEGLWVGLVPFAQSVNIGNHHTAWLDQAKYSALNYGPDPWWGCVDARAYPLDTTDDPPSVAPLPPYHWADHNSYNDWITSSGYRSGLGGTRGPNKYCSQEITPLTPYKSTILSGINAMAARGNTHTNFGMVWGWRMLSPRWREFWAGDMPEGFPLDYNTPLMNKVAILLTDGQNTHSNSIDTAYGYLSQGKLNGITSSGAASDELDRRLTMVCDAMKEQGILVYTITFQLSDTGTQSVFRECATHPAFYFNSPTNEELTQAFHTIADSLGNLRISK